MKNFEAPFLTFTNASSSPNYLGEAEELAALHRRTEALDQALRTGKDFDILLDMLADDGQNPCEYVDEVKDKIELVIARNLVPEDLFYWAERL